MFLHLTNVNSFQEHGESDHPHRPFDPNQPKFVILLAYQRVGSSFTGQLFNQNPDLFYLFEPVDGIYSAMYGTQEGYAVPSDIAFFWNGTIRYDFRCLLN